MPKQKRKPVKVASLNKAAESISQQRPETPTTPITSSSPEPTDFDDYMDPTPLRRPTFKSTPTKRPNPISSGVNYAVQNTMKAWFIWAAAILLKGLFVISAISVVVFLFYKTLVEGEVALSTIMCGPVNRSPWSQYFLKHRLGWTVCEAYRKQPEQVLIPTPDPNLLKPVVRALIDGSNLPSGSSMHEHRLSLKRIGMAIQAMKMPRGAEIAVMVKEYNQAALEASDFLSGVAARHKVTLAQTRSTLESLAELLEPISNPSSTDYSPSPLHRDDIRRHFVHIADDLDKLYSEASKAQDSLRICDQILWDLSAIAANESARLDQTNLEMKSKERFLDWIKQINKNTTDVIVREQVGRAVGHLAAFSGQVDAAHVVVSGVMQAVTDYRKEVEAYSGGVANVGIRQLPLDKQVSIIKGLLEELDGKEGTG
ncbi:hypothetical protein HK097_005835 [Rhizophlyctis rosea]|uniref:Uncharacterized protein n=1 Tax=Rhizophlyctis rosea TaxID=64517 RepID=A0AAD5SD21_9FUNG|nr:hypothetical protein HK097_005835 [Rhizophlyctis rosea]